MSTQTIAQAHLDDWLAADTAVSQGLSYSIAGRTLTRENSAEIRANITNWAREVRQYKSAAAGSGSPGVARAKFS